MTGTYREAVQEACGYLPAWAEVLWVASWHSAGTKWTEVLCSGLMHDTAEAQVRTIIR